MEKYKIMKIISKVKIHPLYYITALICILTGTFKSFIIVNFLIFIHEIGHILAGMYYKWSIKCIHIFPFGGMSKFDVIINSPIKEELVVALSGPLFQFLGYFILEGLGAHAYMYHYALLLFNLLPIIPLDGSKILSCILYFFLPFKNALKVLFYLSIIFIIIFIIYSFLYNNFLLFLMIMVLIKENYKYYKNINYIFYKFLLERYFRQIIFNKRYLIYNQNIKLMKKDYNHLFKVEEGYLSEKAFLKKVLKI